MTLVSVVLPVRNQADHIGGVVESYRDALARLPTDWEILMVPNVSTDRTPEICQDLTTRHAEISVVQCTGAGWGRAVKSGIAAARGELICYTNSARTQPEMLALMILYAVTYPTVIVKANRRVRDSLWRRVGSVLYNLECRAIFDLPTWDVNGTPKVFPRSFDRLLHLERDDDLIDAEFVATCRLQGYPLVEVPILATVRHGGKSTTNYRSALRMYIGAFTLKQQL